MEDSVDANRLAKQGHAQRPEVRILTWQNEELATDALSIHGYEHYMAKDYVLAYSPFSGKFFLSISLYKNPTFRTHASYVLALTPYRRSRGHFCSCSVARQVYFVDFGGTGVCGKQTKWNTKLCAVTRY